MENTCRRRGIILSNERYILSSVTRAMLQELSLASFTTEVFNRRQKDRAILEYS